MLFKKRRDKVPRCPNGHILEPGWDHCPYCEDLLDTSAEFRGEDDSFLEPDSDIGPAGPATPPGRRAPREERGDRARRGVEAPARGPSAYAPPPPRPAAPEPPPWSPPAARPQAPEPPLHPIGPPGPPAREPERGPIPSLRPGSPPVPPPAASDDITVINVAPPAVVPPAAPMPSPAAAPAAPPWRPPAPGVPAASPAAGASAPTPAVSRPAASPPTAPPFAPAGGPSPFPSPAPPPPAAQGDVTQVMSAPVGERAVVAWLVVGSGPLRGRDFRLPGGTLRIGSNPACEICLTEDPYISGRHAELTFAGTHYVLRDLKSRNGSFVNDNRVDEQALRDGDRVRLGQTHFVFKSFHL